VRLPLTIHCPSALTPTQAHRLGRIARTPGFAVVNRVLGWVVLAGQFVALGMVASFLLVALFGESGVLRVLWSVLVGALVWVAYRLLAHAARSLGARYVLDLQAVVWAMAVPAALAAAWWVIARGI
jgi:hypothetical protein